MEALVYTEHWEDTRRLLELVNPVQHPPDTVLRIHAKAIAAAGRAKQVDVAMGVFNRMKERSLRMTTVCYNCAIDACRRAGRVQEAQALFEEIQSGGKGIPRPDVVTYSSMIGMYAHLGRVDEALDLLFEMDDLRGLRPNARTYAGAVIACDAAKQPRKAKQLLEAADRACKMPDQRLQLWQIVVGHYVKTGRAAEALEGLKTMLEKEMITEQRYYTEVIKVCRGAGWYNRAVQLLYEALDRKVHVDHRTYSAALDACARGMLWKVALSILADMQSKSSSDPSVAPDRKCFTTAMVACGRAGRWVEAQKLMEQMSDAGLEPDVVSYNVLLDVFAKSMMWERALDTLEAMAKVGIKPDLVSYNTALDGCARAGKWRSCRELMENMRLQGVNPDVVSYTNALAGCWIGKQPDEAIELVEDMERGGTESVTMTNGVILDAMRKAFGGGSSFQVNLVQLLKNMEKNGMTPDMKCYGAVLHALGQSEHWETCLKVSSE